MGGGFYWNTTIGTFSTTSEDRPVSVANWMQRRISRRHKYIQSLWTDCFRCCKQLTALISMKHQPAGAEGRAAGGSHPRQPGGAPAAASTHCSSADWLSRWTGGPTQHLWWPPAPSGSWHRPEGCQHLGKCLPYTWEQRRHWRGIDNLYNQKINQWQFRWLIKGLSHFFQILLFRLYSYYLIQ